MKFSNIIQEEINRFVRSVIIEDKESKNMSKTRKYIRSVNPNYDANQIVHELRNDIPNVRVLDCKYLLGVARLYLNNELNNYESISNLNRYLKVLCSSQEYSDKFDNNFNGLSYKEIENMLEQISQQMLSNEKDKMSNNSYKQNEDYRIIPINSFEEAEKYSKYTSWCVTSDYKMFCKYTKNGLGRFYFCLKNGFEDITIEVGSNCPLDDYGLSMIAVSVNDDGSCNTITCRWNHDNGGNDNVMTPNELSDLLGINFYEVFKPYTDEEQITRGNISIPIAKKMLEKGTNPNEIFDDVVPYDDFSMVLLNDRCNFITTDNKLLSDTWFDYVDEFDEGFVCVKLNGKFNFISTDGELLSDTWFDKVNDFYDDFASIKLNGKYNFISTDGELLSDTWFDEVDNFNNGFGCVFLNDKFNFISTDGELLSDTWFDYVGHFHEGFANVKLNDKWNFISTYDELLSDTWFDEVVGYFYKGFARIKLNDKLYYLSKRGELKPCD